jgi:coniferyl-aldehyde dehydrogenase
VTLDTSGQIDTDLRRIFDTQRSAFLADPPPSTAVRRARIDRLLAAVLRNADELCQAIAADFGQRSTAATLGTDILGPLPDVLYTRRKIRAWSKPRRVLPGLHSVAGTRATVVPRPLGVVGVMAPWNFPLTLALQPTFAALAAGNRVMLKVSEVTPRTASLLQAIVSQALPAEEVVVVVGDAAVAAQFSALPFDHLFFTGSPETGKRVQRAASDNLVPVTLELGGKNPAIVGRTVDLAVAAKRITSGRMTNGGQLCLCPDYALVPAEKLAGFVDAAESALSAAWPSIAGNPQYPWIVNDRNYNRLQELLQDAAVKGANVRAVAPQGEQPPSPERRWMPPTLVWNLTDDMRLAREEVFGPILSVIPYDSVLDVLDHIAARPSPLAAYWYGSADKDFDTFAAKVRCGGLTRNDFAVHALPNGAPFGGVGASGSGYYHGRAGFDTFSHLRSTASTSLRFSPMAFATPPFSARSESAMRKVVGLLNAVAKRRLSRSLAAVERESHPAKDER